MQGQRLNLKTKDVVKAYKKNKENRSATARQLNCSPATVAYHLRKAAEL